MRFPSVNIRVVHFVYFIRIDLYKKIFPLNLTKTNLKNNLTLTLNLNSSLQKDIKTGF